MPNIHKIGPAKWQIDKEGGMRVPGIIYANDELAKNITRDRTMRQTMNVATLPGIIDAAYVMPDAHEGYGFPIGGVAAFDLEEGIISPGGVGYDINCGVRLVKTNLTAEEIKPKLRELVNALFTNVPSGVGSKGKLRLTPQEMKQALTEGSPWAIAKGYGWAEDRERTEEYGCIEGALTEYVSQKAISRGAPQFGTLGAGNHSLRFSALRSCLTRGLRRRSACRWARCA